MPGPSDLLPGTLDLLVLRTLAAEPMHGWAISQRIRCISNDVLRVHQGSLYPALHRLEHQALIRASWGISEQGRRARFYSLTALGCRKLNAEASKWARLSAAVDLVLSHG